MRNWRPSTANPSRRMVARTSRLFPGRCSVSTDARSAPIANPVASIARPIAATWAWYQVVLSCAAYQKTVPNAKKAVPAIRTQKRSGSRPSSHQQIPTSSAARPTKTTWPLVASPPSATNGTRMTAGSGGNGIRPRGMPSIGATGNTSW